MFQTTNQKIRECTDEKSVCLELIHSHEVSVKSLSASPFLTPI
jgi:hypothetical protein